MLTREHAISEYERGTIRPDRLNHKEHGHYARYSERMLLIYRHGEGRTRQELHRDVHNIFADEENCPTRRIDAFCKLLDDVSEFEQDRRGQAAALRRTVFRAAAAWHPLVSTADSLYEHDVTTTKTRIATQLGRHWSEIDRELFADIMEFHRLKAFTGYPDGPALLARYNVAQAQVALFDAVSMTVWAKDDFKTILRYAKLARLMHTIRRVGPLHEERARGAGGPPTQATKDRAGGPHVSRLTESQYEIRFDGPASVLRETRRYGVAMARFLPALVACRGWRMHAVVQTPRRGWTVALDLSPADRLNSHLPRPDEFDSDVEAAFAAKWGPDKRDGWSLVREAEILHDGQKVFVPDFVFRHDDGRTVLMEIIGFWTPEYLQAKVATLRHFNDRRILLAVAESLTDSLPDLPPESIRFKSALRIGDVLEGLAAMP